MKGIKKLHYRLDFENTYLEYDYTICSTIEHVAQYLNYEDTGLGTKHDLNEAPPSVKITGVWMTDKQYSKWLEKNVDQ